MRIGMKVEVAVAKTHGVEWVQGRIVREHFEEELGYRYDVHAPSHDCTFTNCAPSSIRVDVAAIRELDA